jgi:hypothetical protein
MGDHSRRASTLLSLAVLIGAFSLLGVTSAVAEPTWEGGRAECPSDQQVRLVFNYRGVLYIQWSEDGGQRHEAGPYGSPLYKTSTFDTGAPVVVWRGEAKPDRNGIPGDIGNAYATCL